MSTIVSWVVQANNKKSTLKKRETKKKSCLYLIRVWSYMCYIYGKNSNDHKKHSKEEANDHDDDDNNNNNNNNNRYYYYYYYYFIITITHLLTSSSCRCTLSVLFSSDVSFISASWSFAFLSSAWVSSSCSLTPSNSVVRPANWF